MGDSGNVGFISLVFIALGVIQAWITGSVPWYIGGAAGLLIFAVSGLGVIPIFGPAIYWYVAKIFLSSIGAVELTWILYSGLVFSIIYTVVVSAYIAIVLNDS